MTPSNYPTNLSSELTVLIQFITYPNHNLYCLQYHKALLLSFQGNFLWTVPPLSETECCGGETEPRGAESRRCAGVPASAAVRRRSRGDHSWRRRLSLSGFRRKKGFCPGQIGSAIAAGMVGDDGRHQRRGDSLRRRMARISPPSVPDPASAVIQAGSGELASERPGSPPRRYKMRGTLRKRPPYAA